MTIPEINFFNEDIDFTLRDKRKSRSWIIQSIQDEDKIPGMINFVFCSDKYLHELNIKYLEKNTYTDIITFDMTDNEDVITGDVYISIERARDNARKYKQPYLQEIRRLMIHGVLHLIGYKDKEQNDKKLMTEKEDYYLPLHP